MQEFIHFDYIFLLIFFHLNELIMLSYIYILTEVKMNTFPVTVSAGTLLISWQRIQNNYLKKFSEHTKEHRETTQQNQENNTCVK